MYLLEAKRNPKFGPLSKATIALRNDRYKLIHFFRYSGYENKYEFYDLVNDPDEMEDRFTSDKMIALSMREELEEKLRK
jgi:hypothetical protein